MDLGVISVRYARALLKSALSEKQEETVYEAMLSLAACYVDLPELKTTIDNPMISAADKRSLLETACGSSLSGLVSRFISLVLKEGRGNALQLMASSYVTLYRRHKNIVRGRLVTASPVAADTEKKVRQIVKDKTSGTVEFNTEVNPDILGGFILEYGTYRMDASVKTQLRSILQKLKK